MYRLIEPELERRADIQSLRALAVALVLAAHAHIPFMEGGYIGVDVFFVLSGYLISGLILRELDVSARFDPWRFYARRLKRLLPALLLVLISTAALSKFIINPQQQLANYAAGTMASIWLSNIFFSSLAVDYFSTGQNVNLFIHTWSLAVEEQFYIAWPWLMLLFAGFWSRNQERRTAEEVARGLLFVLSASLAFGIYSAHTSVEAGFYLMPGRAWEFALGALTFLARQHSRFACLRRLQGRSLLNTSGWLIILATSLCYTEDLRYPGAWALFPCIGAALVLIDNPRKNEDHAVSRILLKQPLLQFFGNISYSLYLWHWPILILGMSLFGNETAVRLISLALSIGLAAITYSLIEKPIHRAPATSTGKILTVSAAGMALSVWFMGTQKAGVDEMLKSPEHRAISSAKFDIPHIYSLECDTWFRSAELSGCAYGAEGAAHTVVMFGDSILAQWFPAVYQIYLRNQDWRMIVLTKSGCPASKVSYYYSRIKAVYETCDLWRDRALDYIEQLRPDVVFMGSNNYGFDEDQWVVGTRAVLDRLNPAVRSTFIISPTPHLGFDGPNCLANELNLPHWSPLHGRCENRLATSSDRSIAKILEEASAPYGNAKIIDLSDSVCPDGLCTARFRDGIRFRDDIHLTASFVKSLTSELENAIKVATLDGPTLVKSP